MSIKYSLFIFIPKQFSASSSSSSFVVYEQEQDIILLIQTLYSIFAFSKKRKKRSTEL
jgi:hypothetical protein